MANSAPLQAALTAYTRAVEAEKATAAKTIAALKARVAELEAGEGDAPVPTPVPDPTPPPGVPGGGIYLSPAEVARIATSGAAWDRVKGAASGSWGSVNLADNNSNHDVLTLAGAIVAARTGDSGLRAKVASSLDSVAGASSFARVLEMSRQIPAYVFAADLIGYESDRFDMFLASLLTKPLTGHSGGGNMLETAQFSANNWGAMSRAACAAIAVRTGRADVLRAVADTHRAWCGETAPNKLTYSDTSWHASSPKAGINRRGATRDGHSLDGVIPEDQRRTGESYTWPAPKGSYPWECLQGAITTGVILHRAGAVSFTCGDNALVRAAKWLTYENANPATGDDTWLPWLLNHYGGANLPTQPASTGKNGGWTDLTHPGGTHG